MVLTFGLLDRANILMPELLHGWTDAARALVEQWQRDLATVRAQLGGRACVYCGAQDQDMRPHEAWGEAPIGRFECIDAGACEARRDARLEAEFDAYLEAQQVRSQAEEATANMFWEQDRREGEEEADRPVSLDVLLDSEEI